MIVGSQNRVFLPVDFDPKQAKDGYAAVTPLGPV